MRIAVGADIEKAVERSFQTLTDIALVVGPERDREGLKPFPIVLFEYAGHQERRRMRIEISGQVCDADLVVVIALSSPQRGGRFGIKIACENPRGLQLLLGRVGDS